ncbi:unnamed protein product [Heligmosomoides polygyrus]|uniref:Uncharacterized protein n=1 Tax=Heligmosomoides polygyrus TaxID=6339 RepID=A0A3P7Z067_HELPZ|nr:unnamed protein product [Heligmosomoides polygyrus]
MLFRFIISVVLIFPHLGKRLFARLRDDHSLVVYDPGARRWLPEHLKLDSLNIRGLHETFGRAGHRMGAIESPLSVYSDGPVVVARIKHNQKHFFYRITFGNRHNRRGWALFSGGIDRMFYTIVGENTLVVVGIRAVAVAPLQVRPSFVAETNHRTRSTSTATGCSMFRTGAAPKGAIQIVTVLSPFLAIQNLVQPPTLVECALMSLQDRHCKEDGTGARSGGLTPEDVEKMVGYRGSSLIPV